MKLKFVSILKKSKIWTPKSQSRAHAHTSGQLENPPSPTFPVVVSLNSNNLAVALPTEILRAIFLCFVRVPGSPLDSVTFVAPHVNPPKWIAITQVCQRWRYVALGINRLWTIITRDLSPKWIFTLLQRSSYAPTQICIDMSPISPLKRPLAKPLIDRKRRFKKQPLTKLPIITIDEILSHTSHVESLHFVGEATDIIQVLMLLDSRVPLVSLSIHLLDPFIYSHEDYDHEPSQEETPLILPDTFLGGGAPQLRSLHSHYGLHVTFPSWVLGSLSEFTVSHDFDVKELFVALRQMPQLEVLRLLPQLGDHFFSGPSSDEVTAPIHLENLNLLVFVDSYLELLVTFLTCLSAPANVRKHLKLTLCESQFNDRLWDRFSSLMCETIDIVPDPPHGIHLIHEFDGTRARIWGTPSEQGLPPSPWPPLHDLYSLEVYYPESPYMWDPEEYYYTSSFHRLQRFCADLGGFAVRELLVDCRMRPITTLPEFLQFGWRPLLCGFPFLRTLSFGANATVLLASISKAITAGLLFVDEEFYDNLLPRSLQRIIIERGEFCTRILWKWIHYAFALPAETDFSDLRKDMLTLLSNPHRIPADVNPMEEATKGLLVHLLRRGSLDDLAFKLTLVECKWDEPDGFETLRLLLRFLDLDWDVILETKLSD